MINLRSLVSAGVPVRYTVLGDTLFGANAVEMQAFAGFDIGEERLVRVREPTHRHGPSISLTSEPCCGDPCA
ncbi:MAG: hypothetical protein ACT4P6_00525 [Gemmatimonadaceae bacterium]